MKGHWHRGGLERRSVIATPIGSRKRNIQLQNIRFKSIMEGQSFLAFNPSQNATEVMVALMRDTGTSLYRFTCRGTCISLVEERKRPVLAFVLTALPRPLVRGNE